jgi:hypothetical protein
VKDNNVPRFLKMNMVGAVHRVKQPIPIVVVIMCLKELMVFIVLLIAVGVVEKIG